ncbi:MAG: hypothetical protein V4565_03310 [Bacteroidota bacterium]
MKGLGIGLIVIGVALMIFTGINFTTKENVVDLGPLEINKEKNHPIKWSPIIGGIILVSGIVVLLVKKK